jgi:hypothetical protein
MARSRRDVENGVAEVELETLGAPLATLTAPSGIVATAFLETQQPQEGSLIKSQTDPAVFLIEGGHRRWIPDAPTLLSQWTWDQVQVLPDVVVSLIPLGEPYPSILARDWVDGSLLQGSSQPAIYVMQAGRRRLIPNWATFVANGYSPQSVQVISDAELNAIPLGEPLPLVPRLFVDTGFVHLGANHWMQTRAGLLTESGHIDASTRTATFTWFGGYHGGTKLLLADGDDIVIGETALHRFGVDGTWIGQSDRSDYWSEEVDSTVTRRTTSMTAFLTWAPNDFDTQMATLAGHITSLGEVIAAVAPIATSVKTITG